MAKPLYAILCGMVVISLVAGCSIQESYLPRELVRRVAAMSNPETDRARSVGFRPSGKHAYGLDYMGAGHAIGDTGPGGGWLALAEAAEVADGRTGAKQPEAKAKGKGDVNTGQDFTKPLSRFDLRYKYQRVNGKQDAYILTPRLDVPIKFESGWQIATRVDLPIMTRTDVPSRDNPSGDYESGMSDLLTQVLAITPPIGRGVIGFGTQVIWPTADQDQFGAGKYQLVPTLGGVYYPAGLPKGSFIGGLLRYQFDVAGKDNRTDVEQLIVQPFLNINLPRQWFVTFGPEMRMNLKANDNWHIPFDITVGKLITKSIVVSVEGKHTVVNDFDPYDWEVEFRIGFFF